MSLLLEALKKAEKAKEEARLRAEGPGAGTGGLSLVAEDAPPAAQAAQSAQHVTRKSELPSISQPLEILSEDIATPPATPAPGPPGARAATTAESTPRARPRAAPARTPEAQPDAAQASERAAAKNLFDAKFKEPNPRLPFYIVMGLLSAFAIGTGVYFWYQLRPPPSLYNASPQKPGDEKPVEAAPLKPAAAAQAIQPAPAVPGLPGQPASQFGGAAKPASTPPAATAPAATSPGGKPAAAKPAAQPRRLADGSAARRGGEAPRAAAGAADPAALSIARPSLQVSPKLEAAWLAYNAGNLSAARTGYQDALREEPDNRDALLGMAALELRAQRLDQAERYYRKVLEADPREPHAHAGLLALRAQLVDPVQLESRVKTLIAGDPDAFVLYFTLGNQYAQQGRWPEAQQAYFKAFAADPENPDFAYNLAVSLDHVRQPKLALEYYRRALSLSAQRASSFDQALARIRVQELTR